MLKIRGKVNGALKIYQDLEAKECGMTHVCIESDEWMDVYVQIMPEKGIYPLYMEYEGAGSFDFVTFTFRVKA